MSKCKVILIWIAAFVLTVAAAMFQRLTGPTHPYKERVTMGGTTYPVKLLRSAETGKNAKIIIPITDSLLTGTVNYRRYPSTEEFTVEQLTPTAQGLEFELPQQKAAGKVEYQVVLSGERSLYNSPKLHLRYKDPVPAIWLVPHILIMFAAMLLAVASGLFALAGGKSYPKMVLWSGILLFIGGLVLGPIVQKYAFGAFWTGVPLGWDLTDNKTLLVMLVFIVAIVRNFKKPSRTWTIAAVIVLLLVYSIPHSVIGSELDHQTGKVVQANR